jgi:hypothetical protein
MPLRKKVKVHPNPLHPTGDGVLCQALWHSKRTIIWPYGKASACLKASRLTLSEDEPHLHCPKQRSVMNNLKNLAGNDVSIFLFRFEIIGNGISFVLNQEIAMDMYHDVDEKLKPLAHVCCETLARYRHLSVSDTIMDGNILDTGEFEVMLSRGLGRHFPEDEKQQLFR